ncbi:MAG: hypothetical protein LBG76_05270 [Treponema sp.]|nr:hypothetical protein [Treponema sp.]
MSISGRKGAINAALVCAVMSAACSGGTALQNRTYFDQNNILVKQEAAALTIRGPFGSIEYDMVTGLASVYKPGSAAPYLTDLYAETMINGGKIKTGALTRDLTSVSVSGAHSGATSGAYSGATSGAVDGGFGPGVKVTVRNKGNGLDILQNYYVYAEQNYLLLDAVVASPTGVETNYIAPVVSEGAAPNRRILALDGEDTRFLLVPYDNDEYVRYRSDPLVSALIGGAESYEVTAVFDNQSRQGMVAGSVSHDTWKTGVQIKTAFLDGRPGIYDFRVFGGVTSFATRDVVNGGEGGPPQPHGSVGGTEIRSPTIFLGFFDDWRNGMEEYGKANGIIAPPLAWDNGPPFGWNSWSAVADKVSYDIYVSASDFIKQALPEFNNGRAENYINFDSFWDNLSEDRRIQAAEYAERNGQIPGIYHTPFTCWHDVENSRRYTVEGTGGQYLWYDLLLKDKAGNPLPYIHGKGLPLDPTHPGTSAYNRYRINQFVRWGFKYVKLDFLSHGAMEGEHYDKTITTGIQAYNYGMTELLETLKEKIPNQEFFVSLSIAPLFPSRYAHGRRISCDVFGTIDNAEYMINSLSYGWWIHNAVYPYNDPDHIVVYNSYNHRQPLSYNEGLTRYIASAITGGFMIDSDDITIIEAANRAAQILNNAEVNALAASGKTFRPVEGNTGDRAACAFVRVDGEGLYLALFNFTLKPKTMTVNLERLGLDPSKTWKLRNVISHIDETPVTQGSLTVSFEPAEPKLYKLELF